MQIRIMGEGKPYREIVRRIAGVLALLLAVMTVSASLHRHDRPANPGHAACALVPPDVVPGDAALAASVPVESELLSLRATDCALCEWMATALRPSPAVAPSLFVASCTVASVLLAVRLVALCAVPTPRRGLRGPPALSPA
ncbi:MAG: hypothetical protein H8F28_27385 [Fibrella sp.]|nr:hypothetical protein [Armatimonadota bacterium]